MTSDQKQKIRADLIVSAGCVITIDKERRIILDGAVAVSGTDIVAVGKADEIRARFEAGTSVDYPQGVLTPGLIDAHCHPADYLIKNIIDEKPLHERISKMVTPYEERLTEEEAYISSVATMHDMIRGGTTSFLDAGSPHVSAVARAVIDTGIRAVVTPKISDVPGPFGGSTLTLKEAIDLSDRTYDEFHGAAGGRVGVCYDLSSAGVVSDELAAMVRKHSRERGVGVVSHFTQPRPEGDVSGFRSPNLARYARLGLLDTDVTLVHIGWLPPADIELVGKAGTNVVHCPGTAMLGGAGWVSDGVIPELGEAGANITLGTDAQIIGRRTDMLSTMFVTIPAHRDSRRRPKLWPAHEMLEMVTLGAARAMGLSHRIGSLEVGKAADLVVFDATHWRPLRFTHPVNDLVYGGAGSNVEIVVIDGKIVHKDGRYVHDFDMQGVLDGVDRHAANSYDKLGIHPQSRWPIQ